VTHDPFDQPINPTQASFVGAMAIADLVKTTLGFKGMVYLFLFVTCVIQLMNFDLHFCVINPF
jgi:hypothetical protein